MASLESFLALVREALHNEEQGVSLYSAHLQNTLFFSGFSREDQERIREILDQLALDSAKHESLLRGILDRYREE